MAQEIADSKLIDTWGSSGTKIEPDISKIIEGWQLGEQPPHEYMNWLQNTFGSKLNHILKNGIAEWNNETEYLAGSSVQHSEKVWICETANTNSEPTELNANWEKVAINKDLTVTVDTIADLRSISYPSNTVWASGYHTKNDGAFGSHIFRLKGVKTAETDNEGTVIIATIGGVDYVYELQYDGAVNVKWFGASENTDNTSSIISCLSSVDGNVVIDFQGISSILSNVIYIRKSNITIKNGNFTVNANVGFQVGDIVSSDEYLYQNIHFEDCSFTDDEASATLGQFIKLYQVKNAKVVNCNILNGGNGSIVIGAGCYGATIDNCYFDGVSAYTTRRNIWVEGTAHSSFADQLMDITTLERNTTNVPTNLTPTGTIITNCKIRNRTEASYGIYLMNARHTFISDCDIEGNSRCIAVNNYSTDTKISNCIVKDSFNTSGTGILVTQYSFNTSIDTCTFNGSFGGNRAIYVQYGASALISSCTFNDVGSNAIQINMMGKAHISDCIFNFGNTRTGRAIYLQGIDPSVATAGNSMVVATTLVPTTVIQGCYFGDNSFEDVKIDSMFSYDTTRNISNETLVFNNNTIHNVSTKQIIAIVDGGTINIQARGNTFTGTLAGRGIYYAAAGPTVNLYSEKETSMYKIDVVAGVVTNTKIAGGNASVHGVPAGLSMTLVPRNRFTGIARVESFIPLTSNINYMKVADWSASNLTVSFYNLAGTQVSLAGGTFSFMVVVTSSTSTGL